MPETAKLVLTDLVDLTIYAGCEPGRNQARFTPELSLPLMLLGPSFVQGTQVIHFPVGQRRSRCSKR